MDANTFVGQLNREISKLPYITSVDISFVKESKVRGEIGLRKSYRLSVRFNEYKIAMSFALICQNQRIWALDHDDPNGWHVHPLYQTEKHEQIGEKTISEIFIIFDEVWQKVEKDNEAK
jgi:hypothetical protein